MKYTKYGDISALLIELCQPFNDNELLELARISSKMSDDPSFDRAYTAEVKNLYLNNLTNIAKETYKPQRFEDINNKICQKIEQGRTSPSVLLPEYATFSTSEMLRKQARNLKARIAKLNFRNICK